MKRIFAVTLIIGCSVTLWAGAIVSIAAVGDMRFNTYIGDKIRLEGFEYPFKDVKDILHNVDIAYGNLECPIASSGKKVNKKYAFRAEPDMVQALTAGGFDIVDLANNHSGDYGPEAFIETMDLLTSNGILFTGAGMNIVESRRPVIIERNGLTVAFLSYSNTFPREFWATKSSPGTTPAYLEYITNDVRDARRSADIIVVCYHGGDERSEIPKQSQRDIAYAAIDAGAMLVLGHHPHVLQGIEVYRGRPIVYSLGNFMFLSLAKECYDTMIAFVYMSLGGVETLELIPVRIGDARVYLPSQEKKMQILQHVRKLSRDLGTTIEIKGDSAYVLLGNR